MNFTICLLITLFISTGCASNASQKQARSDATRTYEKDPIEMKSKSIFVDNDSEEDDQDTRRQSQKNTNNSEAKEYAERTTRSTNKNNEVNIESGSLTLVINEHGETEIATQANDRYANENVDMKAIDSVEKADAELTANLETQATEIPVIEAIEIKPEELTLEEKKENKKTNASVYNFFLASQVGDTSMILRFLDKGDDINMLDSQGNNALMIAVLNKQRESVRTLIKRDANVNLRNQDGKSALWYAVDSGDLPITKLLLDAGAEVNVQDNEFGQTPIFIAAQKNYTDLVSLLVAHRADANIKDIHGETAIPKDATTHNEAQKLLVALESLRKVDKRNQTMSKK